MDHHPGVRKLKNLNFCCCCGFLNCLGRLWGDMSNTKHSKTKGFWACTKCTLQNKINVLCCMCCGARKPRESQQKEETFDTKSLCSKRRTCDKNTNERRKKTRYGTPAKQKKKVK